ncbi:type II toxin-antitoxin system VapC family toxin [Cryptosporangium sp. NPDC048952]|uniref:type II toxin-antitoxin system VapC family toxin n=1 Tax=Cryptosporangium sp. NPDC048952 TaxID=3363961 RepID=UPI00371D6E43
MNTAPTDPIVVDSSVVIRWLLVDGGDAGERRRATALLERSHGRLVAPALFVSEVLGRISGRTKARGADRLAPELAIEAASTVWDLDVSLFTPDPRRDTAQLLSLGKNLSISDALYVQLADRLETVLYTFDRRLIDGAGKLGLGELATQP